MADNDPFWEAEIKGREEFKQLFNNNLQWIIEGTLPMPFDGLLGMYTGEVYPFEIKKRNIGFGDYSDYILECPKANILLNTYDKYKDKYSGALYVNILTDKLLIWDITKIDLGDKVYDKCPATTAEGKRNYKNKLCYHLKPEDAQWIINIS